MSGELTKKTFVDTPRPKEKVKKSSSSPTKYSRLHEKEDLANLNDRLACYIDRVRSLENENRMLTADLSSQQEKVTREVTSVKNLYEAELSEARKLLDELSRENAKLQIDSGRLFTENEELKVSLEKKIDEVKELEVSITLLDQRLADASKKCSILINEKKKLSEENKNLNEEKLKLSKQLGETRKLLEEEILRRVDAENSLQTTKEQFEFNEQLLKQQLIETQRKVEVELTEFDGKLNQEYEERLYQGLQEIREQYEIDLDNNKEEIKKLYEDKLRATTNQLNRTSNIASKAMSELKELQNKINELNRTIELVENDRNEAQNNIRELERKLEMARRDYLDEYRSHEAEVTKLRDSMAEQIVEYQELMDAKIKLDIEISAYRSLLEGEEARLNITPVGSPGRASNSRKILKAKRKHSPIRQSDLSNYSFTSSTKGDVTISEISNEGKYIKLTNQSEKDISLGRWRLCLKSSDAQVDFKFLRNFKIAAGESVTVWSDGVEEVARLDGKNLSLKGKQWLVADRMTVYLLDSSGNEIASAENSKLDGSYDDESLNEKRKPEKLNTTETTDEKCSIM